MYVLYVHAPASTYTNTLPCHCTNLTGDYATIADDCATPTSTLHKLMWTVCVQYVHVPVCNCANSLTGDCANLIGDFATMTGDCATHAHVCVWH